MISGVTEPSGYRAIPALVGSAVALAMDLVYIGIISGQGGPIEVPRVALVAGVILLAAVLAFAGGMTSSRPLLIPAAVLLLVMGFLGMFSIGLPLLAAGILTVLSAAMARRG